MSATDNNLPWHLLWTAPNRGHVIEMGQHYHTLNLYYNGYQCAFTDELNTVSQLI